LSQVWQQLGDRQQAETAQAEPESEQCSAAADPEFTAVWVGVAKPPVLIQ
jgi:hypothetical protein